MGTLSRGRASGCSGVVVPGAALPSSSCRRRAPSMCCSRRTQCGAWSASTATSTTHSGRPKGCPETGSSPPSRSVRSSLTPACGEGAKGQDPLWGGAGHKVLRRSWGVYLHSSVCHVCVRVSCEIGSWPLGGVSSYPLPPSPFPLSLLPSPPPSLPPSLPLPLPPSLFPSFPSFQIIDILSLGD